MNPMNATNYGFQWRYNVCQNGTPITSMGRVYYVMDDFGNLVLTNERQLRVTLWH